MTWEEREKLVGQYREETKTKGITVKRWCDEKGLSIKTFYNWKRQVENGISNEKVKKETNQGTGKQQKRQWAIMPADKNEPETEEDRNIRDANYQISYGGFTVSLTNALRTETLTEILKAVKQSCC